MLRIYVAISCILLDLVLNCAHTTDLVEFFFNKGTCGISSFFFIVVVADQDTFKTSTEQDKVKVIMFRLSNYKHHFFTINLITSTSVVEKALEATFIVFKTSRRLPNEIRET